MNYLSPAIVWCRGFTRSPVNGPVDFFSLPLTQSRAPERESHRLPSRDSAAKSRWVCGVNWAEYGHKLLICDEKNGGRKHDWNIIQRRGGRARRVRNRKGRLGGERVRVIIPNSRASKETKNEMKIMHARDEPFYFSISPEVRRNTYSPALCTYE